MCAIRIWKATSTPRQPDYLFNDPNKARESGLCSLRKRRFIPSRDAHPCFGRFAALQILAIAVRSLPRQVLSRGLRFAPCSPSQIKARALAGN